MQNLVYILLILIVVYFITSKIKEGLDGSTQTTPTTLIDVASQIAGEQSASSDACENIKTTQQIKDMNAKDLCQRISTKAEEINAEYQGKSDLAVSAMSWFLGFMNPMTYKAGDNTSTSMTRNIVNTTMTSQDIKKISDSCNNLVVSTQLNEIDTTGCDYCQKYGCDVSNVTQENLASSKQVCAMQTAIEILLQKTDSIDAMALGKAMQDAQGILSGSNTAVTENCNVVNKEMSSCSYLEQKKKCLNALDLDQTNIYRGCGDAQNIIQRNRLDNYQECVMGSDIVSKDIIKSSTELDAKTETDQSSTGIDAMASFMSVLSSAVCCCGLVSLAVIAAPMLAEQQRQNQ